MTAINVQKPEKILIDGKLMNLCSTPFTGYFKAKKQSNLFQAVDDNIKRGYIGEWELLDGKLYLTGLQGLSKDRGILTLIGHFSSGQNKLHFEWFTGPLYLPIGELVANGYFGIYSSYDVILVNKGVVVRKFKVSVGLGYEVDEIFKEKIRDQPLTERLKDALEYNNVIYVGDLLLKSAMDFNLMRNLGRKSIDEVLEFSEEFGLVDDWVGKIVWDDFSRLLPVSSPQ